jgi:hypothetical protein
VLIPSRISTTAPAIDIHVLNNGALLRSQPVTPPSTNIGEIAVPTPNKTAKATLSTGLPKGIEYNKSANKGGQRIKPLLKPNVKAPVSNRFNPFLGIIEGWLHSQDGLRFLKSKMEPIIIVTMLKAMVEYA